ncbi:MAG: TVP38/TMEM64 family protein [Candidatus Lambdaproteobacteria bacterium]|nr:TVP38/TMEM64 family protein [Candidatus Lambdaproteobacteria bacterium]
MKRKTMIRLLVLLVLVAAIALGVVYRAQLTQEMLERLLGRLGLWGHLAFVLIWFVAPALMLPGSILTLAAGALFNPLLGTVYTSLGSTAGATLAFLLARYLAGDWVARRAGGTLGKIKAGVEEEGWRFVAFTRLVPLFPFNLLNYAFGLTRIPLWVYVLTSWICMLPGTAGYVYLGYAAKEAAVGGPDLVRKGLWALAVFAVLVLLPLMLRRVRRRPAIRDIHYHGPMPGDILARRR